MTKKTCVSLFTVLLLIAALTPNIGLGEARIGLICDRNMKFLVESLPRGANWSLGVNHDRESKIRSNAKKGVWGQFPYLTFDLISL